MTTLHRSSPGLTADAVEWFLVECPEEDDQPLDEGACADLMLTGQIPTRQGIAGRVGEHYGCFCLGEHRAPGSAGAC